MAVKEPDARVVRPEAQDYVAIRMNEHGVAAHRGLRQIRGCSGVIKASFVFAAMHDLEAVAVEMKRVSLITLVMMN
jgi:hypothetical protein